jgi:hypothetical protein
MMNNVPANFDRRGHKTIFDRLTKEALAQGILLKAAQDPGFKPGYEILRWLGALRMTVTKTFARGSKGCAPSPR